MPMQVLPRDTMERIVHKTHDFQTADEWDMQQHLRMSAQERMRVARRLKDRVYSPDAKDVRACHETALQRAAQNDDW